MSADGLEQLAKDIRKAPVARLFLDYDGTLTGFAPNPDVVTPDAQVIALLERISLTKNLFPAIISGRRLSHIQKLVPVEGFFLAGTYGIEMALPGEETIYRAEYEQVRPVLDQLKTAWQNLIAGHTGFYIEDKDWALALHARYPDLDEARDVLDAAREAIKAVHPSGEIFRVLDGERLLELAPVTANKGLAVGWILANQSPEAIQAVYIGDDDKDEEAFAVIQSLGGVAIKVGPDSASTRADYRLPGPAEVQAWLGTLTSPPPVNKFSLPRPAP